MGMIRDRMVEDLRLAGLSESTRVHYVRYAVQFVKHFMRSPNDLGEAEVRRYLLHLMEQRKLAVGTLLVVIGALKFLFGVTLKRPEVMAGIRFPRKPPARPGVLTQAEVRAILRAAPTPYWRTFFLVAYATGLRRMEVANLRTRDIDATSGLIRVACGKGGKAREVMLDPILLAELRAHWRAYRLTGQLLFPARTRHGWADHLINLQSATGAFRTARKAAGIARPISLHGLRHAFATHLLEQGVDLATLRQLLGHDHIETTAHYTEVRTDRIRATRSPLASLATAP